MTDFKTVSVFGPSDTSVLNGSLSEGIVRMCLRLGHADHGTRLLFGVLRSRICFDDRHRLLYTSFAESDLHCACTCAGELLSTRDHERPSEDRCGRLVGNSPANCSLASLCLTGTYFHCIGGAIKRSDSDFVLGWRLLSGCLLKVLL